MLGLYYMASMASSAGAPPGSPIDDGERPRGQPVSATTLWGIEVPWR